MEQSPEATALIFGEESLSYKELDSRADRLAAYLRNRGIRTGTRVGICMETGFERIVAVLGVLKAGGAYVPLDPQYPAARLDFMGRDSGMALILTERRYAQHFEEQAALNVEEWWESDEPGSDLGEGCGVVAGPEDLAYVIYTSGSTGRPKGVMIAHRGLCNLALAASKALGITSQTRVVQLAPFSFDASVWEIFTALVSGAALVLGTREELLPGPKLASFLRGRRVEPRDESPPLSCAYFPRKTCPILRRL